MLSWLLPGIGRCLTTLSRTGIFPAVAKPISPVRDAPKGFASAHRTIERQPLKSFKGFVRFICASAETVRSSASKIVAEIARTLPVPSRLARFGMTSEIMGPWRLVRMTKSMGVSPLILIVFAGSEIDADRLM